MRIQTTPFAGFLNVDKPQGWTSSDVVAKLRSAFQLRRRGIKIGHGGTLDPLATGVLPVCVGFATRLAEFLLSGDKTYLMSSKLGVATDTFDSDGQPTAEHEYKGISETGIISTLAGFVGEIDQVPPMFSAIKRHGQPLYKLARQGKSIHRDPRRVTVDSLALVEWSPPHFAIRIECGSGFYARSLAHDIGHSLGCGAHMTSLRREKSGVFRIEDSVSLEALLSAAENDAWRNIMLKPDAVLHELAAFKLNEDQTNEFVHGRALHLAGMDHAANGITARVYGCDGQIIGLAKCRLEGNTLEPVKVFAN